ncbi:hypothetical protein ART_3097 [Arthrobacter sp. PAMC 25486]|nr:hypothetical protein ART_3097 [Arthrobacter sp. PAMC 25486]
MGRVGLPEDLAKNGKEDQTVWNQVFDYAGWREVAFGRTI